MRQNDGVRVKVDQLLFGYRDGHELLASSMEIEPRVRPALLPHADARFEDDAPHYLVGTPIPEVQRYLLARIWPAPELPRPGAVWSHGLLLDRASLGFVDPLALEQLFRRPSTESIGESMAAYSRPLEVPDSRVAVPGLPEPLMWGLCWTAYSSTKLPTFVLWGNLPEAETALLTLWRQQPAAARARLAFRTRGRARTGASPYDVQVAPALRGRSGSSDMRILDARRLARSEVPEWVHLLARGAEEPSSDFSHYFRRFNTAALRSDTPSVLAQLWLLLEEPRSPGEVASFVGARFPKPAMMRPLKVALFGDYERESDLWRARDLDRIIAVLRSGPLAFDFQQLELPRRIDRLWEGEARHEMLEVFDDRQALGTSAAALVFDRALASMGPVDLAQRTADWALLSAAAERRPDLFAHAAFWRALDPPESSRIVGLAVAALGEDQLVEALLAVGVDWLVLAAGLLRPTMLAEAIARVAPTDLDSWERAFSGLDADLVAELGRPGQQLSPAVMLLLAASSGMEVVRVLPIASWLPSARLARNRSDLVARAGATTLLARALGSKSKPAKQVMIECFGVVHKALDEVDVPKRAWKELEPLLPDHNSRDRPGRLRKALVARMGEEAWTLDELTRTLEPAGPQAARIVKLVGKKNPLRRGLENALEKVADELVAPLRR